MSGKLMFFAILCIAYGTATAGWFDFNAANDAVAHAGQLSAPETTAALRTEHNNRNTEYMLGWMAIGAAGICMFSSDAKKAFVKLSGMTAVCMLSTGCIRPFEPVQLESIGANETAFLIPYVGDPKSQTATQSEEFLAKSLVQAQQVKVPQQWVPRGYTYGVFYNNGLWQPAALLIKVDRNPVTREWTAEEGRGTSQKDEAVWVMTADQVEFSTGWTCTAYIKDKEDAVKFLYYYRSGKLSDVMDSEVRGRIQTAFGLEVTDQPMEKLRTAATPHIKTVVDEVTTFFRERGITITNLGISGGFVYKDQSIQKTMVELFNAEQAQAIATAKAAALQKEAQGKADAAKLQAQGEAEAAKTKALGEAESIQSIADAKAYEIGKAKQDLDTYLHLKQLELEGKKIEKWGGVYPSYYMANTPPETLLTLPAPQSTAQK